MYHLHKQQHSLNALCSYQITEMILCHSGKGKAINDGKQSSGCQGLGMEKGLDYKQEAEIHLFLSHGTDLYLNVCGYVT